MQLENNNPSKVWEHLNSAYTQLGTHQLLVASLMPFKAYVYLWLSVTILSSLLKGCWIIWIFRSLCHLLMHWGQNGFWAISEASQKGRRRPSVKIWHWFSQFSSMTVVIQVGSGLSHEMGQLIMYGKRCIRSCPWSRKPLFVRKGNRVVYQFLFVVIVPRAWNCIDICWIWPHFDTSV